jgi:cell division protein FtsB
MAKYNQLLRIEEDLGDVASYPGRAAFYNLSVAKLTRQLEDQRVKNVAASRANDSLAAEINDLREGLEMVEERARAELGMIKANEIYVQVAR